MAIERKVHIHEGPGGLTFESMIVQDPAAGEQTGALLFPNFKGTKEWDFAKAEELAALGFKVLVVDYYGQGNRAQTMEEGMALLKTLVTDRALMRDKLQHALGELRKVSGVKAGQVAAIGFCLGGKCVLDLARAGEDLAGVVFHGLYDAPPFPNAKMIAKILINHGWNDTSCPPEATVGICHELTEAGVDWQLNAYGHVGHAFTANDVPMNADKSFGYDEKVDARSWLAMKNFFAETF